MSGVIDKGWTRRQFLAAGAVAVGGTLAAACVQRELPAEASEAAEPEMEIQPVDGPITTSAHVLPPLPYAVDALEPAIDTRTMTIHHQRHHQAYINGLIAALEPHDELRTLPVDELLRGWADLPEELKPAVRDHGGGHHNHSLFWESMAPGGRGAPTEGTLGEAISSAFGSADGFKEAFSAAAMGVFGSGWAWLVQGADGRLEIKGLPNQNSPLLSGDTPLLGLDVWEHAYYLHYQNRRADYVSAWFDVVDWEAVARRLS